MLECQRRIADLVDPVWAVGEIDGTGRHLSRKSDEVECGGTAGLNAPTELPRQSPRNLIDVRAQALIEELAETWVVIDAANDAANLSALFQPVESRVNSRTASEVKEVSG